MKGKKIWRMTFTYLNVGTNDNPVYEITIIKDGKTFLQDYGRTIRPDDADKTYHYIISGQVYKDMEEENE